MESSLALIRHIQPDNPGHACGQICLYFFSAQSEAVLVIDNDVCSVIGNRCFQRVQPLLVAETIIRIALFHQLFRIFKIQPHRLPFTLYIRAVSSVFIRSFVVDEPRLF